MNININYKNIFLFSGLLSVNGCVDPAEIIDDKPPIDTNKQPNIVVFIADDLGSEELGCFGGKNISTPHIDSLASEGLMFTNHFASSAMSMPVRASLFTGLYPMRHGTYQNQKPSYSNIKSITHFLPELGYRVGRTGKQHTTPRSVYNFEEVPGFEINMVSPTVNFNTNYIRSFIENNISPFCLFVCSTHPHTPWTWGDASNIDPDKIILPPNLVDNSLTRERYRLYLAEIGALDVEVGAVIDALKKSGKLDNTLILFLGEQGPQFPGAKWTSWNHGLRGAMIARYPKMIASGQTTTAITQYEDILPTLIDFVGGAPIGDLDGKSFLDVLFGKTHTHRDYAYGIHNNIPEGTAYPIRSIQNNSYKLILNLLSDSLYYEQHVMPDNTTSIWYSWSKTAEINQEALFLTNRYLKRPAIEFYDLINDPWELDNIANNQSYSEIIANMKDKLEQWMVEQGDTGVSVDIPF